MKGARKIKRTLAVLALIVATVCLVVASSESSTSKLSNEETILDDLVNQILRKSKETFRQEEQESQAANTSTISKRTMELSAESATSQPALDLAASAPRLPDEAANQSAEPYLQLISLSPEPSSNSVSDPMDEVQFSGADNYNNEGEPHHGSMISTENVEPGYDYDKHIQYDTSHASSAASSDQAWKQNASLELPVLQPAFQGEVERTSGYKSLGESFGGNQEPLTVAPANTFENETFNVMTSRNASDERHETPAEPPASNSTRSGQVQARSMGNGALTRILHHSKAPYASAHANYPHGYPNVAAPPPEDGQQPRQVTGELSSRHLEESVLRGDSMLPLVSSINRISTHLASDASMPARFPQAPESTTMRPPALRTTLSPTTTSTTTPKPRAAFHPEAREPAGLEEHSRPSLQKLATSISQLVELSPIPSAPNVSAFANQYDEGFSSKLQPDPSGSAATTMSSLAAESTAASSRVTYPSKIAHDFKNGSPDSRQQHVAASQHRKTIESVSNQIHSSDRHQHQLNLLMTGQHELSPFDYSARPANEPGGAHNGTSPVFLHRNGHYAASLINVTAPMTPPLSATEAMESSLGPDQQAAKSLLHQASGFLGLSLASSASPASANQTAPPSSSSSGAGNRGATQYYLPTASAAASSSSSTPYEPQQARVYSQYTPPSVAQRQYNPLTSATNLDPISDPLVNDSAYRNRYDPYSGSYANSSPYYSLVPKSPGQSAPEPVAQASGFRSPLAQPATVPNLGSGSPAPTQSPIVMSSSHTRVPGSAVITSSTSPVPQTPAMNSTTNGFITGTVSSTTPNQHNREQDAMAHPTAAPNLSGSVQATSSSQQQQLQQASSTSGAKRVFNLTRVEHISAECSNDLIRTVIIFNGTFRGIIYSSGYVRDPNCMYINGTGKTRYDFSIRLNQCGTLGRQELHPPSGPNEVRRRDQVMWNTLSIQYNPVIEQEWDEHFRVSCEYGSDFWKTISFNPFNVETNTGSPVIFTVDPPKCQMEILKGHGMVGPRQEAISGPVTVGDPLTLLIHMKSEKAGYDILVKNCIAHNGGGQRMQLIDSNGCVINERFISPFRGTYNDNDLKHVTLYSYLKAFRFTGKPVLYLECEIHMCQSACPPQMCYWRRLSKRSAGNETESEEGDERDKIESETRQSGKGEKGAANGRGKENLSDSMNLFQALEVLGDRDVESTGPYASSYRSSGTRKRASEEADDQSELMCYQKVEVFAFLFGTMSALLAALSVTIGCCWRAANAATARRTQERNKLHYMGAIM